MEKYSGLEAIIILQRHPEYYLSRIYIPRLENDYKNVDITCFIQLFVCVHQLDWAVCTSHLCPWKVKNENKFANYKDYDLRMALHVTTLLTLFSVFNDVSRTSPSTAYLKVQ